MEYTQTTPLSSVEVQLRFLMYLKLESIHNLFSSKVIGCTVFIPITFYDKLSVSNVLASLALP